MCTHGLENHRALPGAWNSPEALRVLPHQCPCAHGSLPGASYHPHLHLQSGKPLLPTAGRAQCKFICLQVCMSLIHEGLVASSLNRKADWGRGTFPAVKWICSGTSPGYSGCCHYSNKSFLLFSCSVMTDSLQPHELQHTRLPCPSLSSWVWSNSSSLSRWCYLTISSSVAPFSFCPQSSSALGSVPVSQLFASGGQSIGVSTSSPVLPMNIQGWSPLGLTGWISLQSKGLSRVFSSTTVQKHQFFGAQPSVWSSSHIHTWSASWSANQDASIDWWTLTFIKAECNECSCVECLGIFLNYEQIVQNE